MNPVDLSLPPTQNIHIKYRVAYFDYIMFTLHNIKIWHVLISFVGSSQVKGNWQLKTDGEGHGSAGEEKTYIISPKSLGQN